ncbi:MAG: hypothetical protein JJU29_01695 [Verrucomicrobia bacterium]|nr:hypothetical protein [Verrucomicrobiota bacterium]MCH8510946.1 hypothetical protein [Kiritimatiellia bacterium]
MTDTTVKNAAWTLRPGASFLQNGSTVQVLIEGETAGELKVPRRLRAALLALIELPEEAAQKTDTALQLKRHGHAEQTVTELLELLTQSGVGVWHNPNVPTRLVQHVSRWTTHVDVAIAQVQAARVLMSRRGTVKPSFLNALRDWGIVPELSGINWWANDDDLTTDNQMPDLVIGWDMHVSDLRVVVIRCIAHGVPLLPVTRHGEFLSVGPLFIRDTSPCPFCSSQKSTLPPKTRVTSTSSEKLEGWMLVADAMADILARRPGAEEPFLQHVFDSKGNHIATHQPFINPRCTVCSRLNRYPENTVIHG